jgi:hypothetical protein
MATHDLDDLEMAERHLADAHRRIARQRRLIGDLQEKGYPTELAVQLLDSLIETTAQMQAHRDLIDARIHDR